jgi:multidrug efflux pump subunit AcrB
VAQQPEAHREAVIAALQAQNAVSPSGSLQTGDEKLLIRVSGAFRSENSSGVHKDEHSLADLP